MDGMLTMRLYLASLGAGLLVGVVYSLLNVRSPAPPAIALVGLLGILVGEQLVPLGRRILAGDTPGLSMLRQESGQHLFGHLPGRATGKAEPDKQTEAG
jgi:XapX domain-containing protein